MTSRAIKKDDTALATKSEHAIRKAQKREREDLGKRKKERLHKSSWKTNWGQCGHVTWEYCDATPAFSASVCLSLPVSVSNLLCVHRSSRWITLREICAIGLFVLLNGFELFES